MIELITAVILFVSWGAIFLLTGRLSVSPLTPAEKKLDKELENFLLAEEFWDRRGKRMFIYEKFYAYISIHMNYRGRYVSEDTHFQINGSNSYKYLNRRQRIKLRRAIKRREKHEAFYERERRIKQILTLDS